MENQVNQVAQEEAKDEILALDVVEKVEPWVEEPKDFSAYVQVYGDKLNTAAKQAQEYLSEQVGVVGGKIKDLQEKDLSQVAEEAKEYARKKPVQALAISAAAGFILGVLIKRTRR